MRTRLKVCCISSVDEMRQAVAAGASAIGLVSSMPSGPGVIEDGLIAGIASLVPPPVSRFLLTSRTEADSIIEHVRQSLVDTVQLVDSVSLSVYLALRRNLPSVRIVQVIHVQDSSSIEEAKRVARSVNALLLDSGQPFAKTPELGGTGRTHNWSISRQIVLALPDTPVFLAGGIRPENAAEAIRQVAPYGLDVCSGVRTDGKLDPAKLAALVAQMGQ